MNQCTRIFQLLVVEDQDDQWFIIQQAFYYALPLAHIIRVKDVTGAINQLTQYQKPGDFSPQLVLMDLYLPQREDGYQVLEAIRALPTPLNQLPIIILSNSMEPNDIKEAYQRGCASFVTKPLGYPGWVAYLHILKTYWCDTVTLPARRN